MRNTLLVGVRRARRWVRRNLDIGKEVAGDVAEVPRAAGDVAEVPKAAGDVGLIRDPELDGLWDVFETFDEVGPSYMHALHETKRRMTLVRRMGIRHPWWDLNAKLGGYRFAASQGLDHPKVFGRFSSIDEVEPRDFGERFLLKPEGGSTNRGVFGLESRPDGVWLDRISGRTLDWTSVVEEYRQMAATSRITERLIVEELLSKPGGSGEIPDDFKVYCFFDRAALVMQRDLRGTADRKSWRFKFWSRDWQDLGPVKYPDRVDPGLRAAGHGRELIEQAERLGSLLRLPFVRLDFYDTDRGPVFGEATLNPGPPEIFTPEFDAYLGAQREFASARLLALEVEGGVWDHLLPPPDGESAEE